MRARMNEYERKKSNNNHQAFAREKKKKQQRFEKKKIKEWNGPKECVCLLEYMEMPHAMSGMWRISCVSV